MSRVLDLTVGTPEKPLGGEILLQFLIKCSRGKHKGEVVLVNHKWTGFEDYDQFDELAPGCELDYELQECLNGFLENFDKLKDEGRNKDYRKFLRKLCKVLEQMDETMRS